MQLDAGDLREFYARPLGSTVRRLLTHRLRARWRDVHREVVIGVGYATPYLGIFRGEAARLGAFMPVAQGAIVWPNGAPCHTVLADEDHLPLPDNSVDRVLIVHGLEVAERVEPYLREIWRVMKPEGRLIAIVPNRSGLWARFDRTPFGHGRPFSRGQLERIFGDALFSTVDWTYALHMPPLERKMILRSTTAFERAGQRLSRPLGGVIMLEAKKEVFRPLPAGKPVRALGGLVTLRP
jgi:SAM-dependent methyltransferase